MYRLGFTESTLLFYYFLDNYCDNVNKKLYEKQQYKLFIWLYSTSGFYDKTINMDTAGANDILKSAVYNNYFNLILKAIKNYKKETQLNFHKMNDELINKYMNLFFTFINKKNDKIIVDNNYVFNSIKNKNITIINNLGSLMKKQYNNGNLKRIYGDFPVIKKIDFINVGYTFFNNGPYKSILESVKNMHIQVDEKVLNTDLFIISSGAYSVLLAKYITQKYNKDVLVIGGSLATIFGVKTLRGIRHDKIIKEKVGYFIDVPNSMKPKNYNDIEKGCYW